MGKGDKKTKKGKIWKGSYGNSRKRKVTPSYVAGDKVEKVDMEAKPKAKKAPKKAARKKAKAADKE